VGEPMSPVANFHAWIFVSHSSADLARVREIRNYLEDKGASPLLFHLMALKDPEEFWPIIEKEIAARNFFLLCESEAADKSEWVQRERATVAAVEKRKPLRIGSIRVDTSELDRVGLDDFLAKTRVFPSFSQRDRPRVQPFLTAMGRAGFQVFDERSMPSGVDWRQTIERELEWAARTGWVVVFLSQDSLASQWAQNELRMGQSLGARFMPVLLERLDPALIPLTLQSFQWFDATVDPANAPQRVVKEMLLRKM
jgi:TIR domain